MKNERREDWLRQSSRPFYDGGKVIEGRGANG